MSKELLNACLEEFDDNLTNNVWMQGFLTCTRVFQDLSQEERQRFIDITNQTIERWAKSFESKDLHDSMKGIVEAEQQGEMDFGPYKGTLGQCPKTCPKCNRPIVNMDPEGADWGDQNKYIEESYTCPCGVVMFRTYKLDSIHFTEWDEVKEKEISLALFSRNKGVMDAE